MGIGWGRMKKRTQNTKRRIPQGRKTSKLYRPSGAFPFPNVRGKTLVDVYVTMDSDQSSVTLRFDDNTDLVVDIEPRLSFSADYSDWKTGNERIIKRWPRIRSK